MDRAVPEKLSQLFRSNNPLVELETSSPHRFLSEPMISYPPRKRAGGPPAPFEAILPDDQLLVITLATKDIEGVVQFHSIFW